MADVQLVSGTDNFDTEVLKANLPVLVHFTATWCGPCKVVTPILTKFSNEFSGKVKIVAVDIDDSADVAKRYNIRSLPTLTVFASGQKTNQHQGLATREKLIELLHF